MSWSLSPTSGKKLHVLLEGSSSSSWWLGGWRPPQDISRCCCWFVSSFHHSDERVKVRSFSSSWNCSLRSLSLNRSFELLDHTSGVISVIVCALPSSQNATALSRAAIIVAVVVLSKLPSSTLGLLYVCHRFTAALSRWKRLCFNITLLYSLYTPKLPQHTVYTCRFAVLKLCLPLDGADEPDPAAGMCLFIWCVCVMSCFRREMWRPSGVRRTRGSERFEMLLKWWSLVWTISWRTNSSLSWVEANTASLSLLL